LRRLAREDLCLAGFGLGTSPTLLPQATRILAAAHVAVVGSRDQVRMLAHEVREVEASGLSKFGSRVRGSRDRSSEGQQGRADYVASGPIGTLFTSPGPHRRSAPTSSRVYSPGSPPPG